MKKIAFLFVLFGLMFCSACENTKAPFIETEETQESTQSDENAETQNIGAISFDKLIYTNLDSEASVGEVRDILIEAGIEAEYVDTVLDWAADYNNCMRGCSSFSLVGDFITVNGTTVDYGDYYPMSDEWYHKNNRNYHDILCRIAAYELNQDNISVEKTIAKEDFDCWDNNTAWLYTDGDILFGREAVEGEHKAYVPFPLIDWSEEAITDYFTLFDPITVAGECDDRKMLRAIQEQWNERGISFKDNDFSLISFWTQSGDRICATHAATLIETGEGYLLFEKTNPESPYAATKFSSVDEVKQYLYDMMNLDYSRYNEQVGVYIILKNDQLL